MSTHDATMRAAIRAKRRAWLMRRVAWAVDVCARVIGYAVMLLAVALVVGAATGVWQ